MDRRVTRDSFIASLESEESVTDISIRSEFVVPVWGWGELNRLGLKTGLCFRAPLK
jgi:hypothetical protein